MSNALDGRPLLERLKGRTRKYSGISQTPPTPLATDIALHKQSIDEITGLNAENEALRKALGGMLFAFDDGVGVGVGVGEDWSAPLLDHARTLCSAVEFKP